MILTERYARVYCEVSEPTLDRFGEIERAVLDYADLSYVAEAEALLAAMPAFSRCVLGEQFARCVAFVRDTCGPPLWGGCEVSATCTRHFGDCEDV